MCWCQRQCSSLRVQLGFKGIRFTGERSLVFLCLKIQYFILKRLMAQMNIGECLCLSSPSNHGTKSLQRIPLQPTFSKVSLSLDDGSHGIAPC